MEIIFPIDGDMLHAGDGVVAGHRLRVEVVVAAEAGNDIRIGGVRAIDEEGRYVAGIVLSGYDNTIEVRNETTGEEKMIRVYWLPDFSGGYRLSIDDNIWFLRDIHQH